VRRGDVVVDDGGQVQGDVVLCHADLTRHFDDLDLNIDLDEALGKRVDLDETGVDSTREAAELGDQTNVALRDRLVGVGADDAARNGTAEADRVTKRVD
jgi:hypothetical protein